MKIGDKVVLKKEAWKSSKKPWILNVKLMIPNRLEPIEVVELGEFGSVGLKPNDSWTLYDKLKIFWVHESWVELVEKEQS